MHDLLCMTYAYMLKDDYPFIDNIHKTPDLRRTLINFATVSLYDYQLHWTWDMCR